MTYHPERPVARWFLVVLIVVAGALTWYSHEAAVASRQAKAAANQSTAASQRAEAASERAALAAMKASDDLTAALTAQADNSVTPELIGAAIRAIFDIRILLCSTNDLARQATCEQLGIEGGTP